MKKRFLSIFLIAVLLLSAFGVAACKKKGDAFVPAEIPKVDGQHDVRVSSTQYKLIENGKSDYRIVVPAEATSHERLAAQELSTLMYEATGIRLPTITDEGLTFTDDSRYLSVGDTALFTQAGVEMDISKLGVSGVRVKTVGRSVFMNGGKNGRLYAAYEFLKWQFGFEFYAETTYALEKNVTNKALCNFEVTDIPDFDYCNSNYLFITKGADNTMERYRMVDYYGELFIPINGKSIHNTFNYLPVTKYQTAHPYWYSLAGDQLCYTARGDEEQYTAMVHEVATIMEEHMILYPDRDLISFSMEDTQTSCQCKACLAEYEHYNDSNVASVIKFINRVKAEIDDWFESDGAAYKRDLKIYFLAYHALRTPPVVYNEKTDTYSPIDDDVVCADGVCPWFAETNGDYTVSFYDAFNRQYAEDARAWSCLASNDKFFWSYSTNVNYYFVPYNSFNAMVPQYKFAKANRYSMMFDQAANTSTGRLPAWQVLKAYLNSKLAWNVNLDMEELIDDFFENYFGPGAHAMREWFESYRVHTAVLEQKGYNGSRSIFYQALRDDFWPKGLLDNWLDLSEQALAAIDALKDADYEQWKIYNTNVRIEQISPYYMLASLYQTSLSEEQLADYRYKVCSYTSEFKIDAISEFSTIVGLYRDWGYA